MKLQLSAILLTVFSLRALSQDTTNWQAFYPYHTGDVRQYQSVFTGEITHTDYTDSVVVDSLSQDQYVFGRNVTGSTWTTKMRVDSSGNLYNMDFQPEYVRYKLYADSGDSWIGGYVTTDSTRPVRVTVQYTYNALIFGVLAKVKVFRFEFMNFSGSWFWIGNDHLAEGFGLVKEEVEPSDVYQLSGAIIGGLQYGVIVSVQRQRPLPETPILVQCYPNPFNNVTVIQYELPWVSVVDLEVYDILGRLVTTVDSGKKERGVHRVIFKGEGLASATYLVVLRTPSAVSTQRILLTK